jgi:hypothetical protein
MLTQAGGPWWAAITVWAIVNAVNVLQVAGFLSRLCTGSMATNHALGFAIMALALPALAAVASFVRAKAAWLSWAGPAVFLAFVLLMIVVDYAVPTEFRSPARPVLLVPYLVLFFGAILLMGLPMFSLDRRLWFVTVATTALLLGSMGLASLLGVA